MEQETLQSIKALFNKKKWVKLAFLFGSRVKGRAGTESDFDIGVWPEDPVSESDMNKLWLELERLLRTSVDLVSLPNASPTVAWEAFRGVPLAIKDECFYINKMLEVSDEAEDFQNFVLDVWKAREASVK